MIAPSRPKNGIEGYRPVAPSLTASGQSRASWSGKNHASTPGLPFRPETGGACRVSPHQQEPLMTTPTPSPNADCKAPLPAPESDAPREIFCGIPVHPFASQFPLLTGAEFDGLVASIREAGTLTPAETHEGLLIDGRNRARAVDELQRRGYTVQLPTVEWQPQGPESVEEHIYALNVHRRHLTDDQRATFATTMLPVIRRAREARQAATRFSSQAVAAGQAKSPANTEGLPRSSQDKAAATSVGQLARIAKVSGYKAAQAVALADSVAAGEIPRPELEAVQHGDKRLRDVTALRRSRRPARPAPHHEAEAAEFWREMEEGAADGGRQQSPDDHEDGDADPDDAPECTETEVLRRWERFKRPFAISDHRELRRLTARIIADEQDAFDRKA